MGVPLNPSLTSVEWSTPEATVLGDVGNVLQKTATIPIVLQTYLDCSQTLLKDELTTLFRI